MQHATSPAWITPLEALKKLPDFQHYTLLYSASREQNTGRYSYLAWDAAMIHTASSFDAMPLCDPSIDPGFPQWFGWLTYDMRHDAETGLKPHREASILSLPAMFWVRYAHLLRFDHVSETIDYFHDKEKQPDALSWLTDAMHPPTKQPKLNSLFSNMTRAEYEQVVRSTIKEIRAGNFYQANITRKFFGVCDTPFNAANLFDALCAASPSPYSALMHMQGRSVLSSSPEGFISVDEAGRICTRPIKGSIRREANDDTDVVTRERLMTSSKNHAENLMIVDLMRNDLARICEPESVKVSELARLYSYATIHHLISRVEGMLKPDITHGEMMRALFPPGSMTGAPKIAAMNWCAEVEPNERGLYSGTIGWLGAKQSCELSVVIRTLLLSEEQFEFQVGGGIVADSVAQDEWSETIAKARGICQALGIASADLEAL